MFHVRDRRGQSLIEVLVGVAIGAMLIAAATFGVAYVIRASRANQNIQTANLISQELLNNVRTMGEADWFHVATSSIVSGGRYFFGTISSSTFGQPIGKYVIRGEEGVFDDDPLFSSLSHRWGMDEEGSGSEFHFFDTVNSFGLPTNTLGVAYTISSVTSTCKIARCFLFNETGTEEMDYGWSMTAFSGSPASISVFVKPIGDATSSAVLKALSIPTQTSGFDIYTTAEGGARVRFFNGSGGTLELTNNAKNIFDGNWHLITTTYDDATLRLYIDDIESGVASGVGYFPPFVGGEGRGLGFGFGCSGSCSVLDSLYRGYMDEVRVYNRVVSKEEIQRILKAFPFTRYFSVSDVCRTTDASSTVVEGMEPPCGSYAADPTTKKVSVIASWLTPVGETRVTLNDFITRWKNRVFRQTDWVGGAQSESTVLTQPNDKYASSTGIDITSGGSLKLEGF